LAYHPPHSTETALLHDVKNDILHNIDDQKAVTLLLLDLSAAVDVMDYTLLVQRLEQVFGVNGLVLN